LITESENFCGAVILIPTRNRADLAMNAIRSVVGQPDCDIEIIVSDNSNSAEEVSTLTGFCSALKDERLRYIRPPEAMNMAQHWDWAVKQALAGRRNHVAFLSDRMMFKPGTLASVIDILKVYPDDIVCYMHDKVHDFAKPYYVYQNEWTGKLLRVLATRLLQISADSVMYDASYPRMLNCFVPRTIFNAIQARFGTVFSSISPDWNFAYRALAIVDSVLYFHKAALVHYAQGRSTGESAHRGIQNEAHLDFVRTLGKPITLCAPFPEIINVWNGIVSEYCLVKAETQSGKFPEIDLAAYMQSLAQGIAAVEDPAVRMDMETMLRLRGWNGEQPTPEKISLARKLISPRRAFYKLESMLKPKLETPEQALQYALNNTRRRSKSVPWEEALHRGTELPIRL
jgi:hypothetical protein